MRCARTGEERADCIHHFSIFPQAKMPEVEIDLLKMRQDFLLYNGMILQITRTEHLHQGFYVPVSVVRLVRRKIGFELVWIGQPGNASFWSAFCLM